MSSNQTKSSVPSIKVKLPPSTPGFWTRSFSDHGHSLQSMFGVVLSAIAIVNQFIHRYNITLWIKGVMALLVLCVLFSDVILIALNKVLSLLGFTMEVRKPLFL